MIGQVDDRIPVPATIRVEACSACQLRCPSCPQATGEVQKQIGVGYLKPEDFQKLLDRNPGVRSVEISNRGEPFLNPKLPEILRIAYERGVEVTIYTGANLNDASDEALEAVVKYGVRDITCSVDGASQETYAKYRVKGDYDTVLGNIKKLVALKKKYDSPYPRLLWQFVVFGHNEHEIAQARAVAEELGLRFFPKLSWDPEYSPIRDIDLVRRQTGQKAINRAEYADAKNALYLGDICDQMWVSPQIHHDGRLLGCCTNYKEFFPGNAFEDLEGVLNSEPMRYARAMLRGEAPPREDIPCTRCPDYYARKSRGVWVDVNEPKKALKRIAKRARARVDAARHGWALMRAGA